MRPNFKEKFAKIRTCGSREHTGPTQKMQPPAQTQLRFYIQTNTKYGFCQDS